MRLLVLFFSLGDFIKWVNTSAKHTPKAMLWQLRRTEEEEKDEAKNFH